MKILKEMKYGQGPEDEIEHIIEHNGIEYIRLLD